MLVERREELPPAEAAVDLNAVAKYQWEDSRVPFEDSGSWVQSLLTGGTQSMQTELLTYSWRRSGRHALGRD